MSTDVFELIRVDHPQALSTFDQLRKAHAQTGKYPFLIGDEHDLQTLRNLIDPPADGGAELIRNAEALEMSAWFKARRFSKPRVLAKNIPPQGGFSVLTDLASGEPKPCIHLGLITVAKPQHLFAVLGYGGWNGCPEPDVHVALHSYWQAQYGAIPVTVMGDVVECFIPNPPTEAAAVLTLAAQQAVYCDDLVHQGYGSKGKLAASLVGAKVWYFWWD